MANAHFRSRHALFLPTCRGGDTLLWILDDFGRSLAAFASDLGTPDVGTLSSAAAIIETLVTLASSTAGINSDNIGTIGTILEEFGKLNMSSFAPAFRVKRRSRTGCHRIDLSDTEI